MPRQPVRRKQDDAGNDSQDPEGTNGRRWAVGLTAALCSQVLDPVHETGRTWLIEAIRPQEALDEGLVASPVELAPQGPDHRARQPRHVLGHLERPAVLRQQVAEMEGPHLGIGVGGLKQCVDRPLDDRSLEQGARVHTEHHGAVVDRVEVVVARLLVHRIGAVRRVDATPRMAGRSDRAPPRIGFCGCGRTSTCTSTRRGSLARRSLNPAQGNPGLVGRNEG